MSKLDTLKGLQSGLFCKHVTGNAKERNAVAKKQMSEIIEDGKVERFIRNAPRSARYRIDWYHAPHIKTETDCLDLDYEYSWGQPLDYLFAHGMDESFNPMDLKEDGKEFVFGDFTLCYAPFSRGEDGIEEFYQFSVGKIKVYGCGYYLKYKGEIDKKDFDPSSPGKLCVGDFWDKKKDVATIHKDFSYLIHQVRHYINFLNL